MSINVSRVAMQRFTRHLDTTVELPAKGVVLVTGPNGHGKSTIVEAVGYALWGETLRGTNPWPEDAKRATLRVDCHDGLWSQTEASKGAPKKFGWEFNDPTTGKGTPGTSGQNWENVTKGREALRSFIGYDFDLWRRTSVFSSSDAAHFTLATDAERKRFLESVLGLGVFDEASDACRADRKKVSDAVSLYQHKRLNVSQALEFEKKRAAESQQYVDQLQVPDIDEAKLTKLTEASTAAAKELALARLKVRSADGDAGELRATLKNLRATLEAMRGDDCPTCEQPISDAHRKVYESRAKRAEKELADKGAASKEAQDALAADIEELSQECDALNEKIRAMAQARQVANAALAARQKVTESTAKASALTVELTGVEVDLRKRETELKVLDACDKVLGMKGVRAQVLASALGGLEAVANGWLGRLAGDGLSLVLKPYVETKKGTTSEALSLDVVGAGGGRGYRASSGGERRRIDLALLLALADVAAAAYRQEPGTMFFDEVFDALDSDGTDRAVQVIDELAQDRCCVVISHSEALASSLRPALHLRIADGAVVR